ncbi:hypothetical protein IPN35_00570 [Candidatus Peregrinibacteria bacterium]|nr:MAG: hypothetical protein IPN35_00570 [Candidatus Peregrinibacteria bacterium]
MTNFQIELAEPEKLFLVYYSLFYHKRKEWNENLKGKYIYFDGIVRGCIASDEIKKYLEELYEEEILTSFYVWDYKIEKKEDVDKLFFIGKKKPKGLLEDIGFLKIFPDIGGYGDFKHYDLYAEINEEKAEQYISEYLEKWKKNDLYFTEFNILRKEKQIEMVVQDIFSIIKNHSHTNFLIHSTRMSIGDEMDFVATVLFLQSVGDIHISGFFSKGTRYYSSEKETIHFRITLTEKFFEDFTYSQKSGLVHFDFKELTTKEKYEKIFFDAPYRIWINKTEYRMNKGKFPYELMNASFDDMAIKSVPIDELKTLMKLEEKGIQKGIDNFRITLRDKFSFPANELFFSVQDGEITLNPKIFKKREKKEEIEKK